MTHKDDKILKNKEDRLRIKIQAYDTRTIDEAATKIVEACLRAGTKIVGPIPLPTKKKAVTLKAKTQQRGKPTFETFERRIHKRFIDVLSPGDKVLENLSALNLPAGVDIEMST